METMILLVAAAVVYIGVFIWLGVATLRNGYGWLFFFGLFFPILWVVGAFIGPKAPREAAPRT